AQWTFAQTPSDMTQNLLDIWFNADGTRGYACGRGGRILKSIDGGRTWNHIDPANPIHLDSKGEPATIWRVRFLNDSVGLVAGLDLFEFTSNGGQGTFAADWADIKVYSDYPPATQIPLSELEIYCLDLAGTPGSSTS